jgi:membrane protein DedA with SNARE-associated domain
MLEWWTEALEAVQGLFDEHGLQAAFVLFLIDELGVPMPLPGYLWPLLLGIRASQGQVPLWQAILTLEVAAMLGATSLYALSAWAGRRLVHQGARLVRISPNALERAGLWLQGRGVLGVVLGRMIPGLRIPTAIACGVFSLPPRVSLPGLGLGTFAYVVSYALLGFLAGPAVLASLEHYQEAVGPIGWLASLVALVALLALLVWTRRSRRSP